MNEIPSKIYTLQFLLAILVVGILCTYTPQTGKETNNLVAQAIFAEAAGTTEYERYLVASVITNRIKHPGFHRGKLETMEDVVRQPGQFASIQDPHNGNWAKASNINIMNGQEKEIWADCSKLSEGNFDPFIAQSGRPIVYFHSNNIPMPSSWMNQWWTAVKELETESFTFYSVIPTE